MGFGFKRNDLKGVAKMKVATMVARIMGVMVVKLIEVMATRFEVGEAAIRQARKVGLMAMALVGKGIKRAEGLGVSECSKTEGLCNLEAETWAHSKIIRARERSRTELFEGKRFSESCLSLSHFESWLKVNSNS